MNARLRKSLADIWRRKGRTLLVALAIFVGVSGLIVINVTEDTIVRAYAFTVAGQAARPDITLVVDRLDATLIPALRADANVRTIQYETTYDTTWHVEAVPGYVPITIRSFPDLQHLPLTPFQLTSGRYPRVGEIAMEYGDLALQHVAIGDTVTVEGARGPVQLRVVGFARTPGTNPATSGDAQAYMSDAGLSQAFSAADLDPGTGSPGLKYQVLVKVWQTSQASTTAGALKHLLQANGVAVQQSTIPSARSLPLNQINGVFTLLRILAVLSLVLSGILILSTVTTLVAEQLAIIGTMKALGGTRGTIICGYLVTVALYGLLGTLPGVVFGLGGGYTLALSLASIIPLDVGPFAVATWIIPLSLAAGLGLPLLAALPPLWNGSRISVRDAFSASNGLSSGRGSVALTEVGQWMHWISQTTWLGMRSTFRRRGRAMLAILTLSLTGATFLVVQTANASVDHMLTSVNTNLAADVDVQLGQQMSLSQVRAELGALPNVRLIEPDIQASGVATRWGTLSVRAFDPDTQMYHYQIVSGRWLRSGEIDAVLLSDAAAATTGLRVGNVLTVTDQGNQAIWTIVGIVKQPTDSLGDIGAAVTSITTLHALFDQQVADTASGYLIQAKDRSSRAVEQLVSHLDAVLNPVGSTTGTAPAVGAHARVSTLHAVTARKQRNWSILYALLYGVTLLVGAVGILGLSNTLTTSVLERRKEQCLRPTLRRARPSPDS